MSKGNRFSRRVLSFSLLGVITSGCGAIPFLSSTATKNLDPRQTLEAYFDSLATQRFDIAENLMTASYRARLGKQGVSSLLHSTQSIQVTDVVDAIAWADQLGAHLPSAPADRREFLVTFQVDPSATGRDDWSVGTNRRFVDLLRQNGQWRIDAIGVSPGVLITGKPSPASNQTLAVVPIEPLRLGPAPIDRAIYTARQSAVDHGAIPWARDPLQVVHHDGPSFGLNPDDPATIVGQDVDPSSLVPRTRVAVRQGADSYVVTLIQPIRTGTSGIWAISGVQTAQAIGG